MKKSTIIILVAIVAIAAFVGGTFYGKASVPAQTAANFGGSGGVGRGGRFGVGAGINGNGGGFVAGKIISKDAQSITIQLPNGNSEVAFYSPSTQIMVTKTAAGSASDLATGVTVII